MMPTMQEIDERENRVKYSPYLHALLAPIFAAARRGVEADQTIAIWQVEIRDRNETIASLKAELAAFKEGLPATEDQNARFAIEGCIEYGRQGVNPPPDDHWLAPFWNMGRQLSELAALKVERDADADRYRWLRNTPGQYLMVVHYQQDEGGTWTEYALQDKQLDTAIDAARKQGDSNER